jgi:glutamine amidotransferase-like uncharacterized protein
MRDAKDLDVYLVSAADIRAGALNNQFDCLVMGGGSSKTENSTLGPEGRQAIQEFVQQGGGYVGICAGAFLAAHNSFGLGITPLKSKPTKASGEINLQLTELPQQLLNKTGSSLAAEFHGGPLLIPTDDASQYKLTIWARFAGALVPIPKSNSTAEDAADTDEPEQDNDPKRSALLDNTVAIAANEFGAGRVVVFGPHCERIASNQPLFWTAIRWAGRSGGISESKREQPTNSIP